MSSSQDGYARGVAETRIVLENHGSGRPAIWPRAEHVDLPEDQEERWRYMAGYAHGMQYALKIIRSES